MAGDGWDDGLVVLPHDHHKVGEVEDGLLVGLILVGLEVVEVGQEVRTSTFVHMLHLDDILIVNV